MEFKAGEVYRFNSLIVELIQKNYLPSTGEFVWDCTPISLSKETTFDTIKLSEVLLKPINKESLITLVDYFYNKNTKVKTDETLKVKILTDGATIPTKAHESDAGFDLYSPCDITIPPNTHRNIKLGIAIQLPINTVGYIFARSGLGSKKGVRPRNCVGVIDQDYRGELQCMLENVSDEHFVVKKGDRICQLVIQDVRMVETELVDELDDTVRSDGGYGSSGR